jgi:hypothetical protein
MARRDEGTAAEMLSELESVGDRLGDWLQSHFTAVVIGIAVLLAVSGITAWIISARDSSEKAASTDLAQTRADYLSAMGAEPGAVEPPEIANPTAAAEIRAEYEKRYAQVAADHPGTIAGTLAQIERAGLVAGDSSRSEEAIGLLEQAVVDAPSRNPVRGIALQRLAQRLEAAERWGDAADRHEAASQIADYPLRFWAIADAARCRALAGDASAARALYDRLDREAPDLPLDDVQKAQRLELRAAAAS